jgi:tetraacyldisaccharide 4'-kinase
MTRPTASTTPAWWRARGPRALALLPLAALYAGGVAVRRGVFALGLARVTRLPVPVIVVGNVTAGGTGKTPLAIHLVQALRDAGRTPGVITRGYGGDGPEPAAVTADADPRACGDEAVLIARETRAPVWRGRDRVAAARALLAAHPRCDVLVSDDGLQHLRLARDVEIAVVDGSRGLGNGWPLPAGPLREPATRLAHVDAVVVKTPETVAIDAGAVPRFAMTLAPVRFTRVTAASAAVDTATRRPLDAFAGQRVHAVAGIGNPAHFFAQLRALDVDPIEHPFPDHHAFASADLAFEDGRPIVMTAKDAIKCDGLLRDGREAWSLEVRAEVLPALATHVVTLLASRSSPDGR